MTALEKFKAARELLSDPKRWTRYTSARDIDGEPISALHPKAVCFCFHGALVHSGLRVGTPDFNVVQAFLNERTESYIGFNDTHTHDQVMTFMDEVIGDMTRNEIPS